MYDRPKSFKPVSIGDELDVRVEAVGEKGDGVVKVKGFVLFVPDVQEGDEVRIKVTKVFSKVGFAEKIGDAQGPIAEDEPQEAEDASEEPAEESAEEAPEEAPADDSEDFGEDDQEKQS